MLADIGDGRSTMAFRSKVACSCFKQAARKVLSSITNAISIILFYWSCSAVQAAEINPLNPTNPTKLENALQGDASWRIAENIFEGAYFDEIAGYASATSVNKTGSINFFVSVKDRRAMPTYSIKIYRMGYYGGAGARLVTSVNGLPSRTQPACARVTVRNLIYRKDQMIECAWARSYTLNLANVGGVVSGAFVAKLIAKDGTATGKANYIPFVVRDDARNAAFMFQANHSTYQAYNNYGGNSYYTWPDVSVSRVVSFNRPYKIDWGQGAGQFFMQEYQMVRFLERNGYDVVYSTNIDTHKNDGRLNSFKGFISVGHDEYWSKGMYDAVDNARNAGVNLMFLGANNAYWQVRFDQKDASGSENMRRMFGYRYFANKEDPIYNNGIAADDYLTTDNWRVVGRPEAGLLGEQYVVNDLYADIVLDNTANWPVWLKANTSIADGQSWENLYGWEGDMIIPGVSPASVIRLSGTSKTFDYPLAGETSPALKQGNMSLYTHAPSGAEVFSAGSIFFSFGLNEVPNYKNYQISSEDTEDIRNVVHNLLVHYRDK
jgi:hypothetical protein